MKPGDLSRPAMLDEQIEALTRELEQRQQSGQNLADAPDLRLAHDIRHAYQAEIDEDKGSLERVLSRLLINDAAERPKVIFLPQVNKTRKRMPDMQTNTMNSLPQSKAKGGWKGRIGLIAAVLCLALLVGGFLSILNATRANHTTSVGSRVTVMPTPQPTSNPASQVIQKAVLTASPRGIIEGGGPGLAGIASTTHFTAGQQIWLFFLVNSGSGGTVTVKWYENGYLYLSSTRHMPPLSIGSATSTPSRNSSAPSTSSVVRDFWITYSQPAEGKVELYWNGQLAVTLFFDVKS